MIQREIQVGEVLQTKRGLLVKIAYVAKSDDVYDKNLRHPILGITEFGQVLAFEAGGRHPSEFNWSPNWDLVEFDPGPEVA